MLTQLTRLVNFQRKRLKQDKFIDIYVSGYGELTATECAIRAGYEKSSAHTRASELLDWRQNPEITKEIDFGDSVFSPIKIAVNFFRWSLRPFKRSFSFIKSKLSFFNKK